MAFALRAFRHALSRNRAAAGIMLGISVVCAFLSASPLDAQNADSADDFVNSVGINVHLNYLDTPYANFERVLEALQQLGVRHVRDGLIDTVWQGYYDRHNQLGRAGIRGVFITSPAQSTELLLDYPRRMKASFEAYEAPNESDQSSDANWAATLTEFVTKLNQTVKSNPATSRFRIIGPSLTHQESFVKLRGICPFDYENLHNYFAGRNPGTAGWGADGYGSISWNLSNARGACGDKPVITTETGYQTNLSVSPGIPEEVAAKYVPRIFLEQWLHGIQRTYLYELTDLPSGGAAADRGYGLLRSDFSSKPTYLALRNLLSVLNDPGPAYSGGAFSFTLTGDLSQVHQALFEKRNGSFFLALWVEASGYDVDREQALSVPIHKVVLQTEGKVNVISHTLDKDGGTRTTPLGVSATHAIEVSDFVTLLEMETVEADPDSRLAAKPGQ